MSSSISWPSRERSPTPAKTEMPLIALDHGVDELHHQHGLADAGAAEHRRLPALRERRQKIDHLDAGREHAASRQSGPRAAAACDGSAGAARPPAGAAAVADPAGDVDQPAEHRLADLDRDRPAGAARAIAAPQSGRRLERDRARRAASSWAWISATTMRPSASTISTASSIGGGPSSNAMSTTAPQIAATRPSNRPSLGH